MIKRALAAALCLMLVFALLPKTARAGSENRSLRYDSSNSTLYLGDEVVSGRGTSWFGDGISLYLKSNFSFTTSADKVLIMSSPAYLLTESNCRLVSVCSSGDSYGIYCNGALGMNCDLTVTCGQTTGNSYGVYAQFGSLTISANSRIEVTGGATTGGNSYGVYVGSGGDLALASGSTLTSTGGMATSGDSYGVFVDRVSVDENCTLRGTGGTAGRDSYGVYAETRSITSDRGGSIAGTGGTAGGSSYGVFAGGDIAVDASGGSITGTGGTPTTLSSYGVYSHNGVITAEGGSITGTGSVATYRSFGVSANGVSGGISVSGGSITGIGDQGGSGSNGIDALNLAVNSGRLVGKSFSGGKALLMKPASYPDPCYWRTGESAGYTTGTPPNDFYTGKTYVDIRSGLITLTDQPAANTTVTAGSITGSLTASAVTPDDVPDPTLAWFRCDKNGTISGDSLGTSGTFTIPTDLSAGTYYYLCRATCLGATLNSTVAKVTVNAPTPAVTSVAVNPASVSIQKGGTQTFHADVFGTHSPAQTVTWSVTGNSSASTSINANGLLTVAANETATTLTVTATSTVDTAKSGMATVTVTASGGYEITQGQHGQWIQGSGVGLRFTANGDYSKFTGVSVDGITLSAGDYTSQSGSTIVTLNAAFLETLPMGRHTLRINFTDGYAETDFVITVAGGDVGPDVPKTGDVATPMLWLGLMLLAGIGLAGNAAVRRRRENG